MSASDADVPVPGQVLEHTGVFRLRVPAGWAASGLEGHRYRVRGEDVTLDVSVHRGAQPAPDARATVLAHARDAGAPDGLATLPLHGDDEPTEQRAGVRWSDDEGWHVAGALCRGHDVVLVTALAADDEQRAAVERVVTTLEPHDRPARWWRRRR
ncbi:hypothetical protein [Cellulomonas palmilytica]|uniref:hypothetical protein n=1 Tax=Cellulomonas palmilytica TaxID=2608402 RepID=UPI001F232260|nr:hypothetical protein [Cellulomonas palmilytica]UJP38595.1 hypothetical protein F1D97_09145 [Cellulomonas palmilytica]